MRARAVKDCYKWRWGAVINGKLLQCKIVDGDLGRTYTVGLGRSFTLSCFVAKCKDLFEHMLRFVSW